MHGTKPFTEATAGHHVSGVGEHCSHRRSDDVSDRGGTANEDAGISSDNPGGNPGRRKPKVS